MIFLQNGYNSVLLNFNRLFGLARRHGGQGMDANLYSVMRSAFFTENSKELFVRSL